MSSGDAPSDVTPARRIVTRRRVVQAAGIAGACALLDALAIEPRWLEVTRHDVPVDGLPSALSGYTIAQITDAHLKNLGAVEEAILEGIREASPQLVVLTGDLVEDTSELPVLAELTAEIARGGTPVVAILGNWEPWGHVPLRDLQLTYARSRTRLLVDDALMVDGLAVYGTDDATGSAPLPARHPERAEASLLLTHSPSFVDDYDPPERKFDLSLAGHTHGGQVRAGTYAPIVPPGSGRFVAGFYESPMGRLYVSRGTGTSIVPARFCCRPELPLLRLVRA